MTRDELLDLFEELGITTQFYCDSGVHDGQFRLTMYNPYMDTEKWDRVLAEIKKRKEGRT